MQINIYIPKEKGHIIAYLEKLAKATGRPKNELVLEALEHYFPKTRVAPGKFNLGKGKLAARPEIYEGRLKF